MVDIMKENGWMESSTEGGNMFLPTEAPDVEFGTMENVWGGWLQRNLLMENSYKLERIYLESNYQNHLT
jgi:hypothetical protein